MSYNPYTLTYYLGKNHHRLKNIKFEHFKFENRNILKYLLFGYDINDFIEEEFHCGLLISGFDTLNINYENLNNFFNKLNSYDMYLIINKREKYKNQFEEDNYYKQLDIIFYKSNRKKDGKNIKFTINFNNISDDLKIWFKRNHYLFNFYSNENKYVPPLSLLFSNNTNIDLIDNIDELFINDFIQNHLDNGITRKYKNNILGSNKHHSNKNWNYQYIQEHYIINKSKCNKCFQYFLNIVKDLMYSIINHIQDTGLCDFRCDSLLDYHFPINSCDIKYIKYDNNDFDKDSNYYIQNKIKNKNIKKYDVPIFQNGLLEFIL
jgi:hypothetical protein